LKVNVVALAPSKELRSAAEESYQSTVATHDHIGNLAALDDGHEVREGCAFGKSKEKERAVWLAIVQIAEGSRWRSVPIDIVFAVDVVTGIVRDRCEIADPTPGSYILRSAVAVGDHTTR